jgi:hypothetical protein
MRKLLFTAALALIVFSACVEPTIKNVNMPYEVVSDYKSGDFDTTYVLQNKDYVYMFDKENNYIGAYKKDMANEISIALTFLIIGLIIGLIFMALILTI